MISICSNNKNINYINWIPSEGGALIADYGSIKNNIPFDSIIAEVHNLIPNSKPIFNLSVNFDIVDIQVINIPDNTNHKKYIEWYLIELYGDNSHSLFDFYQYEFNQKRIQYLNISVNKKLKANLINSKAIVDDGELRCLSLDIFSAECGARQWFKAHDNYIIWKINKRNQGTILIMQNSNMAGLFSVIFRKEELIIRNVIYDNNIVDNFINSINSIISGRGSLDKSLGNVYYYNGGCSKLNYNKFTNIFSSRFYALNPFDAMNSSISKPNDSYQGTSFAETGIGFLGIDV